MIVIEETAEGAVEIVGFDPVEGGSIIVAEPQPVTVTQTIEGERGASAYAVAVRQGFVGSEALWLASLKGQPGDSVMSDPGDLTLFFANALI